MGHSLAGATVGATVATSLHFHERESLGTGLFEQCCCACSSPNPSHPEVSYEEYILGARVVWQAYAKGVLSTSEQTIRHYRTHVPLCQ